MLYLFCVDIGQMLTFEMEFFTSKKVKDLKKEIERKYHIPYKDQILYLSGGIVLLGKKLVSSYPGGQMENTPIWLLDNRYCTQERQLAPYLPLIPRDNLEGQGLALVSAAPSFDVISQRASLTKEMYQQDVILVDILKSLCKDQLLQYQGWTALQCTLEDHYKSLDKDLEKLKEKYSEYLNTIPDTDDLVKEFEDSRQLLERITVPGGISSQPMGMSLYQFFMGDLGSSADDTHEGGSRSSSRTPSKTNTPTASEVQSREVSPTPSSPTGKHHRPSKRDSHRKNIQFSISPATSRPESPASTQEGRRLNLAEWLKGTDMKDPISTLKSEIEEYVKQLNQEHFDSLVIRGRQALLQLKSLKSPESLDQRILDLADKQAKMDSTLAEQNKAYPGFTLNEQRLRSDRDPAIIKDCCLSQNPTLEKLVNRHKLIAQELDRVALSKQEICGMINKLTMHVMVVKQQCSVTGTEVIMCLGIIDKMLHYRSMLRQMSETPQLFMRAVAEAYRRKRFTVRYQNWAEHLSADSVQLIHKEENLRGTFAQSLADHFLVRMFRGFSDHPPEYATEPPNSFDENVPNITEEDLAVLKREVPELSHLLHVPPVDIPVHPTSGLLLHKKTHDAGALTPIHEDNGSVGTPSFHSSPERETELSTTPPLYLRGKSVEEKRAAALSEETKINSSDSALEDLKLTSDVGSGVFLPHNDGANSPSQFYSLQGPQFTDNAHNTRINQLKAAEAEVGQMKQTVSTQKSLITCLTDSLLKLANTVDVCSVKVTPEQLSALQTDDELSLVSSQLTQLTQEFLDHIQNLNDEVVKLKTRVEKQDEEQIKEQLKQATDREEKLKKQIDDLEKQNEEMDEMLTGNTGRLMTQVAKKDRDLQEVNKLLHESKQKEEKLLQDLDKMQKELQGKEEKLQQDLSQIQKEAVEKEEKLRQDLKEAKENAEKLQQDLMQIQKDVQEKEEKLQDLTQLQKEVKDKEEKLQQDLKEAKEKEETLQRDVIHTQKEAQQKEEKLQQELVEMQKLAEEKQGNLLQNIDQLQKDLEVVKTKLEGAEIEITKKDEELQTQLKDHQQRVDALTLEIANSVAELEVLRSSSLGQVKHAEEQHNQELELLKSDKAQALEKLKCALILEHEVEMEQAKSGLQETLDRKVQEMQDLQGLLANIVQRHTVEMDKVIQEHSKALAEVRGEGERALTALRAEHETQSIKLRQDLAEETTKAVQLMASEKDECMAKLVENNQRKLASLEQEYTEALEAARLSTVEKKEKEFEGVIQEMNRGFQDQIVRINIDKDIEKQSAVQELRTSHQKLLQTTVNELEKKWMTKYNEVLEGVQVEKELIDNQLKETEDAWEQRMSDIKMAHSSNMEKLREELDDRLQYELNQQQAQFNIALRDQVDLVAKLRRDRMTMLQSVGVTSDHELQAVVQGLNTKLDQAYKSHQEAVASLEAAKECALQELRAGQERLLDEVQVASAGELIRVRAAHKDEMMVVQGEMDAALRALKCSHETQVAELQQELDRLRTENEHILDRVRAESELSIQKSKLVAELEERMRAAQQEMENTLSELGRSHETHLRDLHQELERLRADGDAQADARALQVQERLAAAEQKHRAEVEHLRAMHAQELEVMRGEHDERMNEEREEIQRTLDMTVTRYVEQVKKVKAERDDALSQLEQAQQEILSRKDTQTSIENVSEEELQVSGEGAEGVSSEVIQELEEKWRADKERALNEQRDGITFEYHKKVLDLTFDLEGKEALIKELQGRIVEFEKVVDEMVERMDLSNKEHQRKLLELCDEVQSANNRLAAREQEHAELVQELQAAQQTERQARAEVDKLQEQLKCHPSGGDNLCEGTMSSYVTQSMTQSTMGQSVIVMKETGPVQEHLHKMEEELKGKEEVISKLQAQMNEMNLSTSTKAIVQDKISIFSCSPGDLVLVRYDERYDSHTLVMFSKVQHFVHMSCLPNLGLITAEGSKRKVLMLAELEHKEYCLAKKPSNRYKLPVGSKFYQVKLLPWGQQNNTIGEDEPTQESVSDGLRRAKESSQPCTGSPTTGERATVAVSDEVD